MSEADTTIVLWILGALFTLFSAGAAFWMKSVHDTLRSIEEKLGRLGNFEGRVEATMDEHSRRIDNHERRIDDYGRRIDDHGNRITRLEGQGNSV